MSRNIDLENYDDLIKETETLYQHLLEWYEQFCMDSVEVGSASEKRYCKASVKSAVEIIEHLRSARFANEFRNRTGEVDHDSHHHTNPSYGGVGYFDK